MTSHELAQILLNNENLPIATFANNHVYSSGGDLFYDGCRVGRLNNCEGNHIIIGNFSHPDINFPNDFINKMIWEDQRLINEGDDLIIKSLNNRYKSEYE